MFRGEIVFKNCERLSTTNVLAQGNEQTRIIHLTAESCRRIFETEKARHQAFKMGLAIGTDNNKTIPQNIKERFIRTEYDMINILVENLKVCTILTDVTSCVANHQLTCIYHHGTRTAYKARRRGG